MDQALEILRSIKTHVVNFCQRICFSFDDATNDDNLQTGERSRLLPAESNSIIEDGSQESLQTQEPNYYNQRSQVARTTSGSVPKSRNDDQSVLNDILSTMANEVLDVALVNQQLNQTIETGDYQERSHQYGKRLNKEAANLVSRHNAVLLKPTLAKVDENNDNAGLVDISTGEVWSELGIADTDTMLIDEVVTRAKESSGPHEFHLREVDRVLARFEARTDEEEDEEDQRLHLGGNVRA